jgi:membrane-associated phospholipid phosphatase
MKSIWDNPWFTIPVLLYFAFGLALLLLLVHGEELLWFNAWRSEPLNTFFRWWTHLGEAYAFFTATVVVFFINRRYALLIAITGMLTSPMVWLLKDLFATARPVRYMEELGMRDYLVLVPGVNVAGGYTSFPSGHTMAAFALYSLLSLMLPPRLRWFSILFAWTAILVGISRIFLVQHFLSDILGGAMFGLMISGGIWAGAKAITTGRQGTSHFR